MKYLKRFLMVLFLSKAMIFAEGDLPFNDDLMKKTSASSAFLSQSFPVFFGHSSFQHGRFFGVLYFAYVWVSEGVYAGLMNFSFTEKSALTKNKGVLNLTELSPEKRENFFAIIPPAYQLGDGRDSPCFDGKQSPYFIGSPLSSPGRKRFRSNSYVLVRNDSCLLIELK